LQRSRFQRVAPVGREFPPFSSTSSSVPCNISVGKAAEGRSGKRATSNSGGCNQKYRTPPNASSTARSATALNVGSGCCSSKRGRWCRLPTPPGWRLIPRGRWRARP
jgi:hypothetical protein